MGEIVLRGPLFAKAHQTTNGRWRSIKNRDFETFGHTPPAIRLRILGSTLEEYARNAVHQWSIDDIAVPGHPAYIGSAPVDIVVFEIEGKFCGRVNTDRV